MSTLTPGSTAPEIQLPAMDGSSISLMAKEDSTPVVAAFFKISCPTCQYALPYIDRIFKAYAKDKVKIVGVSQDDKASTARFIQEYAITFPVLLDDIKTYPVSNAYQLTNVPSTFLVGAGKVKLASIGWVKEEFEQLNRLVAEAAGMPPAQIFKPGEEVKDFKAA